MSKDEREAAINQKIKEIRQKNASISQRHQEIENDKKNAEKFSQEATKRMKTRSITGNGSDDNSCVEKQIIHHEKREFNHFPIESRKIKKKQQISDLTAITDFRPQRLSEEDLPPPDPVFSYLTDRLREGAFCAPISPATNRKHSTSSQSSEMSIGSSSRSSNSRRASTTSNSSWTSDTSSKYDGFSNYQPPRRYSVCRDYVRNRRLSERMNFSDETEDELWKDNKQGEVHQNRKDSTKSFKISNTARGWESEKVARVSLDVVDYQTPLSTESTQALQTSKNPRKKAVSVKNSRSENVTNWRKRHINYSNVAESDMNFIDGGVARLEIAEDTNNNNDMINHNLNMHII